MMSLIAPGIDKSVVPLWYALYTRSRYEKKVAEQLRERCVEYFLPLVPTLRQWKYRKAMVEMPMFPGYIFVYTTLANALPAITAKGVVRIVGFNGVPSPIPESEIESILRLFNHPELIEPESYFEEGNWVEIIHGPFSGVRGKLIQHHGRRRVRVGIDLIQQAVSVEVDMSWVRPLKLPHRV